MWLGGTGWTWYTQRPRNLATTTAGTNRGRNRLKRKIRRILKSSSIFKVIYLNSNYFFCFSFFFSSKEAIIHLKISINISILKYLNVKFAIFLLGNIYFIAFPRHSHVLHFYSGRQPQPRCELEDLENASEITNASGFWSRNCFCDDDCQLYGDCCLDKALNNSNEQLPVNIGHWNCELVTEPPNPSYIYTLWSCPSNWSDIDVMNKCYKNVDEEEYSFFLDVPVFSLSSKIVYANFFCAECHQDVDNLVETKLQVNCNKNDTLCMELLPTAFYRPSLHQWSKEDGFSAFFDFPQFHRHSEFRIKHKIRQCRPVVDHCADNWPDPEDNYKCQAFSSYVRHRPEVEFAEDIFDTAVFKNPFCAKCNYAQMMSQECVLSDIPGGDPVNIEGSFSLLFDFGEVHQTKVGVKRRCPIGQLHDPVHGKCVEFSCGALFVKSNGICVPKENELDQARIPAETLSLLNDSCPKLHLSLENHRNFPNGSIYLYSNSKIYDFGNYEIQDDHILVCATEIDILESKFSALQSTLSIVVLAISILCLAAHITIHCSISKLRNLPGKNLLSLSIMLFCGQILFFGVTRIRNGGFCEFIAVLMHFCFLSAFFWMNVLAVDICRTFTAMQHRAATSDKNYKRYAMYAWGFSAFIVGCSIVIDNSNIFPSIRPNYGSTICWISQRQGLLVFFAVPLAILLIENVVFFILTAKGIYRSSQAAQLVNRRKHKIRFLLYVKLALIMGFTWILGFVAALAQYDPLWYGFVILNGLQGTFIFFGFSIKKKVFFLLKEKFNQPNKESVAGKSGNKRLTNLNATTTSKLSLSNLNVNAV